MPKREIDDAPFNESTLTKLNLFELYTTEWLPVFVCNKVYKKNIIICDFFCGSGSDSQGTHGSALRLLNTIKNYDGLIRSENASISVYLSDKSPDKIRNLHSNIEKHGLHCIPAEIITNAGKFEDIFEELCPVFTRKDHAKLLFIDQYGVIQLHRALNELISFPATDFLAFLSSNFFHRFLSLSKDKNYIGKEFKSTNYCQIHKSVVDFYRSQLPCNEKYYLGDFSLKHKSNIYGVIFGSRHPLGMEKFLRSAWKLDGVYGSANYDIEMEGLVMEQYQLSLFQEKPSKITLFEIELEKLIRSKSITTELEILELCFLHGVTPKHASQTLQTLKEGGIIDINWSVPTARNLKNPRPVIFL